MKKELKEYVELLKNNGFTVYGVEGSDFVKFTKDNKIGYVEFTEYGFNFSTIHKPCRECGSGFSMHREVFNPTIQEALDCFKLAPNWAYERDIRAVKKYSSIEDYFSKDINKILNYELI